MTIPRKRRKSASGWIILGVVLVAGSFVVRGVIHRSRQNKFPPNAFYQVTRGDLLISVTEEGALRALNETVVRSSLDGFNRIISLAPEGSLVKKGDLLVELDSSALKNTLHEQEIAHQDTLFFLLQAKENLRIQKSLGESQTKEAELRVENAQSDLEKYRDGDAPLLIRTADARIRVLEEQVRIAGERQARTEVLFKNGNATRSEVEADRLTLKREQLGLQQYQEDLRLIQKFDRPNRLRLLESSVQQAKDELTRLQLRLANEAAQAEADLRTSQKALDLMEESLKDQRQRLENAKILAPQDGIVVYAAISPFQDRGDGGREEGRPRMREGGSGRIGDAGGFQGGGGGGRRSRMRGGFGGQNNSGNAGGSSSANRGQSSSSGSGSSVASLAQSSSFSSANAGSASGSGSSGSAVNNSQTTAGTSSQRSSSGAAVAGGSAGASSAGGQRSGSGGPSFTSFPPLRQSAFSPSSAVQGSGSGSSGGQGSAGVSSSGNLPGAGSSSGSGGPTFNFGSGSSLGASRFSSQSSGWSERGSFEFIAGSGIIEEGSMVRQRQELIRLPDISRMLAEVKIEEARIRQIHPGMSAYVGVETLPGRRFKGTVRRVAILPDTQSSWMNPDSKVYATDVLIDDELPVLKPGVSARAEIVITNLSQVLSVPIQSITTFNGEYVCFAKRGSKVKPVPVLTGWFNDQLIEITSGLKEGDLVLLAPMSDDDIFGVDIPPAQTNEVEIE